MDHFNNRKISYFWHLMHTHYTLKPFKTTLLLSMIVGLFVMTSCGDSQNGEDPQPSDSRIVATWYTADTIQVGITVNDTAIVSYLQVHLGISEQEAQNEVDSFTLEISSAFDGQITFNSDYTYNSFMGNEGGDGVWEINDAETEIIMDKGTEDELTILILSLDEFKMKVNFKDMTPIDLDDDQVDDVDLDLDITIDFSK